MATSDLSQLAVQPMTVATDGTASPPSPPSMGGSRNSSLYVGDLDGNVNESDLSNLFRQVARAVSVRICRDQEGKSLGYGFVNYNNPQDATNAIELLNYAKMNGKPIRIMFSNQNPSMRRSGVANVFVKNLDSSIDNKELHNIFAIFGNVLSCKLAVDSYGRSKGFGFVQFDNKESAETVIKRLNGILIKDQKVYVGPFIRQQERNQARESSKLRNVYVKNLSETTTDEELKRIFGEFGLITSAVIMKDSDGKSKCFGFVNFEESGAAMAAIEKMNGISITDGKVLFVGRAHKKAEREAELKAKFEQERMNRYGNSKDANLYIKNLDESITDDDTLKALFSEFGTITSCKVMVDYQGVSKGFGFVAFSTEEEAKNALMEMNEKMVGRKPLYVTVAQRKNERRAFLREHFAQTRASNPSITRQSTRMRVFRPNAPRLAPPHYENRHLSPMRTQNTQVMPQQGFEHMANGRNNVDEPMGQSLMYNHMVHFSFEVTTTTTTSWAEVQISQQMQAHAFASFLAFASPRNRRWILGEYLFPLVAEIEYENAGKVTGMLLEMDLHELLHLIECPNALIEKVHEAMYVLRLADSIHSATDVMLGSLCLND